MSKKNKDDVETIETQESTIIEAVEEGVAEAVADDDTPTFDPVAENIDADGADHESLDFDTRAAWAVAVMIHDCLGHGMDLSVAANNAFFGDVPHSDAIQCASDFVRSNLDVHAGVIPVHLNLAGYRQDAPVEPREMAAWQVFAAAIQAIDNARAIENAAHDAAMAGDVKQQISAPRDRLAFVPESAALQPSGFMPSR